MQSSLATIDRTFHDLALLEREEPQVSDKIKADAEKIGNTVIAGFDITNDEAKKSHIEKAKETRRSNVIKYLEKRSSFAADLNKLGVEPMAILPSLAWTKLWKDAGLFFISTTTGKVSCRYAITNGQMAYGWMNNKYQRSYSKNEATQERHRLDTANNYVKTRTWPEMLDEFATDKCFHEGSNAKIILPTPPTDVIQTLIKVRALSPKTVAVPEAISFEGGAGHVIAEMHKGQIALMDTQDKWAQAKGYENYRDWVEKCPIVFVEKDGVAAIVAQFGPFPIEQALVEKVSKEDFFPETASANAVVGGFYGYVPLMGVGGGGGAGNSLGAYSLNQYANNIQTQQAGIAQAQNYRGW